MNQTMMIVAALSAVILVIIIVLVVHKKEKFSGDPIIGPLGFSAQPTIPTAQPVVTLSGVEPVANVAIVVSPELDNFINKTFLISMINEILNVIKYKTFFSYEVKTGMLSNLNIYIRSNVDGREITSSTIIDTKNISPVQILEKFYNELQSTLEYFK